MQGNESGSNIGAPEIKAAIVGFDGSWTGMECRSVPDGGGEQGSMPPCSTSLPHFLPGLNARRRKHIVFPLEETGEATLIVN